MMSNDRLVLEMMTEDESRPITPRSREAVAAALQELDALRAAGDALAGAARDALADLRDRSPVKQPLARALASWVAAPRAATPGPTPAPPPDEPAVRAAVRSYILAEFLPGSDPAELTDDTSLVTGGILDAAGVQGVAGWLAERFGVTTWYDDAFADRFDSVARIAALVMERLAARPGERGEGRR
jgi:hypothetical protein